MNQATKKISKKTLHVTAGIPVDAGGPSVTVPALCGGISSQTACRVGLLYRRSDQDVSLQGHKKLSAYPVRQVTHQAISLVVKENAYDLLHSHGIWTSANHSAATVARKLGLPLVVTPRGMLEPWAMNYHRFKKRVAWWIYQKRDLLATTVFHATAESEASNIRQLGFQQPIAIIPNGVDPFPTLSEPLSRSERPYVLFLSRIHKKKGVKELLEVWNELAPPDWDLVLAGPEEEGILREKKLPQGVKYVGRVEGEPKARLMQQASLFVLPTYSENFGVVVAESLMAGVPVITTHGAPWQSLEAERCGWWIPMEKSYLQETLAKAMATPAEELHAMGARGRTMVENRFAWPEIARQMAEVYQWVLGGGSPPDCVVLS